MTSISACRNLVVGWAVVCGLCRSVSPGAWASESAPLVLEVSAGPYDREKTPIVFTLPEPLAQRGTVRLILLDDGREVSSQRIPGEKPAVAWVLAGRLAPRETVFLFLAHDPRHVYHRPRPPLRFTLPLGSI